MNYVQFVLHLFNAVLFAGAVYLHAWAFVELMRRNAPSILKTTLLGVILSGVGLSLLFIFLQADWVINEQNENVGDVVSWSWLLFDYILGGYLCFNAVLVRNFILWRTITIARGEHHGPRA